MSRSGFRFVTVLLALGGIAGTVRAQQVLSAQSGTIHYIEGSVSVDGQELHLKKSEFPSLRTGQELRTENGRAEMLLTPGAFLRITDHSAVRMVSNRLSDTRIEVLTGSVLAECDDLLKDNAITLLYGGDRIRLVKHGLYRIDTTPAQLRVFDGAVVVESASGQLTLKRGKETPLDGGLVAEKFNRKSQDWFDHWDQDRSALLASASAGASQSMLNANTRWNASGWYFNPYYDLYTFVPVGSVVYSPFGYQFWSPSVMAYYYAPTPGVISTGAAAPITTSPGSSAPSSPGNGGDHGGGSTRGFGGGSAPVITSSPAAAPRSGGGFGIHR